MVTLTGLWLNMASLEALDALNQLYTLGSLFGGKEGQDYIDHLIDIAWDNDSHEAFTMKERFAVAEQARGNPMSKPHRPTVEVNNG